MKRWAALTVIIGFGIFALVLAQMRKANVPVGPRAFLNFVADTAREFAHVPAALTPLSDEEEIRIGDEMAREYEVRLGSSLEDKDAQAMADYVQRVGRRVAGSAHRKLPYKFHYIPNRDFINAFALPGGQVFIGRGLIALMTNEDELADILGHEIEHIDQRHCAERIQVESRARQIPLGGLVLLPIEIFEAGYSKAQELEADREGTALAVWAGYSPLGTIQMLQSFDRLYKEQVTHSKTPQEELSSAAIQTLEGYFRSHPPPQERIEQIRNMIAENHWEKLTNMKPLEVGAGK
ncbi:MAG TPA: M48 family metalloprotease [Terriglobia bacterium]|nr:M48 family metalloprotease [Terriglobia bacterium]